VNFTREPIIETIISPKEGCKLSVRSSRGGTSEEYFVDAIEVVSFGNAFFFRSLERPKAFLVPVMDYEVVEVKETRVALKNVSHERNIKIGGGREAPVRAQKEAPVEKYEETSEPAEEGVRGSSDDASADSADGRGDKKRDRRRHRRRRLAEERREWVEKEKQDVPGETANAEGKAPSEGGVPQDETAKVSSSMFSTLFPPPQNLISETIARYKDKEGLEGAFFTKPVVERHEPKLTLAEEEKRHHRLSQAAENDETIQTSATTTPEIESDEE
jgi:hypothetical protein